MRRIRLVAILTTNRMQYMSRHPRSSRGVFRRRSIGGARCDVPRLRLVTAGSGRHGNPPARHYDLRREELRCTSCGGNAADGSADPEPKTVTVERRKARVPRYGTQGASQAPGRAASWCVQPGAAAPGRLSALRPPLGVGLNFKTRTQSRRGNDKCCVNGLFDNVTWMNVQADLRIESASFAATGGGGRVGRLTRRSPPHVRSLDELVETLEHGPGLGRPECGSPALTLVHGNAPSPVRITLLVAHE
jgi:hypothetical protein